MKKVDIDTLLMMYVVATGNNDGVVFEVFPDVPSCFSEGLTLFYGTTVDFTRLTVSIDDPTEVRCWFMEENDHTFSLSMKEVLRMKPMLYSSIVTHVYDTVMNMNG